MVDGERDHEYHFMTRSGTAWGAAHAASGAPADEAAAAAKRTMAAYLPELP